MSYELFDHNDELQDRVQSPRNQRKCNLCLRAVLVLHMHNIIDVVDRQIRINHSRVQHVIVADILIHWWLVQECNYRMMEHILKVIGLHKTADSLDWNDDSILFDYFKWNLTELIKFSVINVIGIDERNEAKTNDEHSWASHELTL